MSRLKHSLSSIGILIFAVFFPLSAINCNGNTKSETGSLNNFDSAQNSKGYKSIAKADSIVVFAKSLLGKPYKYSSCGPNEFDCSGFVYYVFNKFHVKISRSSYTMAEQGTDVDLAEVKKGDLIFFKGTNLKDPKVGHVGIVISEKGAPVEFIHSSSGKNNAIIITKLSESNYTDRFIKVKRFL